MKSIFLGIILLFAGVGEALAAETIDASDYNLPAANGVGYGSLGEVRVAAGSAMIGAFLSQNGLGSLDIGEVVLLVYEDGSTEWATVISKTSSIRVAMIPNTLKPASSGSGGGGGDNFFYYTGGSLFGSDGACYYKCTGVVTVGEVDPQ